MSQTTVLQKTQKSAIVQIIRCVECSASIEREARFCGECGVVTSLPQEMASPSSTRFAELGSRIDSIPIFVSPASSSVPAKILAEIEDVKTSLAREQLLLFTNIALFLAVNAFGFWLALKCYYEFIGDDLTRLIMALTPFLFVNSLALLCISPVKSTKREIAQLNQRLKYLRFQMDYQQLLK